MPRHTVEMEFAGKPLSMETGHMAKQADGAVFLKYGDTALLATAVASKKPREGADFFPLTVDYGEKLYAAGKIPGGFFRREGRATSRETLIARLTDRPLRPLFPDGFRNDVHIVITVLSSDKEHDPDVMALLGASSALCISDIPFDGPVSAVRMGRIEEQLITNPTYADLDYSDFDFILAGTEEAIVMVEGSAIEVPEEIVADALLTGFEELQQLNRLQRELMEMTSKAKRVFPLYQVPEEIFKKVEDGVTKPLNDALDADVSKLERGELIGKVKDDYFAGLPEETPDEDLRHYKEAFSKLEKKLMRRYVKEKKIRLDGRKFDEIRPVTCEVGLLPRTHGSALFTRGETQALATVTLGTSDDEQIVDDITDIDKRTFMLHYNFPPYSVGEARFMRGPGRREIGHGFLAERALVNVVPPTEDFPYTIRIVSEILESNGSSSMASVCAGSLALFDAGVKLEAPVSGIAMGLIKEDDDFIVLSDIAGWEDHSGDMDFKVTGTETGITAIQMDIKIKGITKEILLKALTQAKDGRDFIRAKMAEALPGPREALSAHAPRVIQLQLPQDKVRDVIGPGGKMIRSIQEETGCKIEILPDASCLIYSSDLEKAEQAKAIIESITQDAEIGKHYQGTVKRIEPYGCFVEILPGTDGLLHISQIPRHVNDMYEEVAIGDEIEVKVADIDPDGKVRLTQRFDVPLEEINNPSRGGRGGGGGRGGRRDDDRGGRSGGGRRGGGGGDRRRSGGGGKGGGRGGRRDD